MLGKEKRNRIERGAEAMEDADEVLECYRRVQRLLERFSVSVHQVPADAILSALKLNANVSTWKTVDELATVSACRSEQALAEITDLNA